MPQIELDTLLKLVGTLDDSIDPGSSSVRFRDYLRENLQQIGDVRAYVNDALAQSGDQFATKAEVKAASARAQAGINMGKRVWNLLGIYGAEQGELVSQKSGPIRQERGKGGGLPEEVLSAVGARRLHDIGRTGWWLLISLVPVGGAIVLIIFYATDGDEGMNEYGPDPKEGPQPA